MADKWTYHDDELDDDSNDNAERVFDEIDRDNLTVDVAKSLYIAWIKPDAVVASARDAEFVARLALQAATTFAECVDAWRANRGK